METKRVFTLTPRSGKVKRAAFTLIATRRSLKGSVLIGRKGLALRARKGFTLIEVLVASSVLFIVSAAVVGLSNSIIQGTAVTADEASANRLATEGLELVTKIRDDTVKNSDFSDGRFLWFDPVVSYDQYGWYQLAEVTANNWTLTNDSSDFSDTGVIDTADVDFDPSLAETVPVGQITYYRFICVEAVGAENYQEDGLINCNTVKGGSGNLKVNDGDRQTAASIGECYSADDTASERREDVYCKFTAPSLNRNRVETGGIIPDKVIPDGNAVRLRSIVIWQDKGLYRTSQVSTLLTNWRSLNQ